MDLKNEISITHVVNALIAFLSLFIALIADKRSRSAHKREHLERKARAYYDMLEVLKKGKELTVSDPDVISTRTLTESHSTLKSIIELARAAIDSVSAAFPNRVLDLVSLMENAEDLINLKGDLEQDEVLHEKVIRAFTSLYVALFALSAQASARAELGDMFYYPSLRQLDPFFQIYLERSKAFQKESERLTDQLFKALRSSLSSDVRSSGSGYA